jgi:hypothetical protein
VSGGTGSLLLSLFNVKCRCYVHAGGMEKLVFCLFLVVFPARRIPSISPRFYFRKHTFCFLHLVTILEKSQVSSFDGVSEFLHIPFTGLELFDLQFFGFFL